MLMRSVAFVFFSLWAISVSSAAWGGTYTTDTAELTEDKRHLYLETRKRLNDWDGGREELEELGAIIDRFIESESYFLPIYIEKARFLIRLSNYVDDLKTASNRALIVVQEIQERDPDYAEAHVLAGYIYRNLEDYENAWKSLERAVELTSEDPYLYYLQADLLAIERRYGEALEFATKALLHAKGARNSLIHSILFISRHANRVNQPTGNHDVASIVFSYYHTPQERISIAESLINSYAGNPDLLYYAQSIIAREMEVTPGYPDAELQLARLLLNQGYRSTTNKHIELYDWEISAQAEQILLKIRNDESVSERASMLLIDIALSNGDFDKARDILEATGSIGLMSQDTYKSELGHIYFIEDEFEKSAAIYEELGLSLHPIQVLAYARLGRIEPLHEFHRKQIRENPDSAWALGNYALFLLTDMDDPDGAIEYGTRALAIMSYGNARNTVGAAYLMKAATSSAEGDSGTAAQYVEMAMRFGFDQHFVAKNCGSHCDEVRKLLEEMGVKQAPA